MMRSCHPNREPRRGVNDISYADSIGRISPYPVSRCYLAGIDSAESASIIIDCSKLNIKWQTQGP